MPSPAPSIPGTGTAEPLVSVITIFLDEERFLTDAVESVLGQTYASWELLLCDDGSSDGSTAMARGYAAAHPGRIRYLEHPGHANRGMSATRNLGLRRSRGELVALLDADDVWLPERLSLHVSALQRHPAAAMVYGPTLFWHSWTGRPEDEDLDALSRLAAQPDGVAHGRTVLARVLDGRADALGTCSVLVRRERAVHVGGFEDRFRGLFEDQVFMSKLLLDHDAVVVGECTAFYRQHADSCCWAADLEGDTLISARRAYLEWFRSYVDGREIGARLRWTIWREVALHRLPALVRARERWRAGAREIRARAVSMVLALGRRLLPGKVRDRLWKSLVARGRGGP